MLIRWRSSWIYDQTLDVAHDLIVTLLNREVKKQNVVTKDQALKRNFEQ